MNRQAARIDAAALMPTPAQDLLLKACLLEGEDALASWQSWRKATNLDSVDIGSIRLLPMLAERLRALGAEDPEFGKYRGVQRRTWARNRLLFRGASKLIAALGKAGIPVMALKGLALASLYYPVESMRPMGDIDLAIPRDLVFRAFDAAESIGWTSIFRRPTRIDHLAIHHALPFQDPVSPEVEADLHWAMLYGRYSDEAEAATWERAERVSIEGAAAVAPCSADLLIHICVHGMRWNPMPPIRWVVDATMIVRSGKVDWDYLLVQARRWGVALPLEHAFDYLFSAVRADIPATVLTDLRNQSSTADQRFLFRFEQGPMHARGLRDVLKMYAYLCRNERARYRPALGCWDYCKAVWQWHSPARLVRWLTNCFIGQAQR